MKKATIATTAAAIAACIATAPLAHADGNAAALDQIVARLYSQVQRGCTPTTPPQFQRIDWDSPPTGQGGSGRIVDATPGLGGPFQVLWNLGDDPPAGYRSVPAQPQGYWDINLEFC